MLAPEHSVTLLEVLEPPDSYQLDVAVGTSYTLDLQALLALPTAFALHHNPTRAAARADTTPLELLEALRVHAGAITVFTDGGHIKLPPTAGAGVFGFLEESVVPVTAPGGGAFHPKVWVIRFVDDDGAFLHRILVASRNLTFDRSWDTMVRLDEDADGDDLPGLTALLDGLLTLGYTSGQLAPHRREAVQDLTRSLISARFSPPEGFTALRLHTLGLPEARERWPFPAGARRCLVVSPFLSTSIMERLRRETGQLTVVSRADELDHTYATTTTAHPVVYEVNPNLIDPDEGAAELSGLHAKVFVFDTPDSTTHVFTGSANATAAAFSRNVEVALELTGPTRRVGVIRWLDENSPSLRSILVPHIWGARPAGDPPARETLERVRSELAAMRMLCTVSDQGEQLTAYYTSAAPLPDLGGASLAVRTISDATWTGVDGEYLDHTARTTIAGLTGFLAVRLTLDGEQVEMAVSCEMHGAPENRHDRLLAHLIASPARLVRYLLMLLTDQPEDRFDGATQAVMTAAAQAGNDLGTVPLLEVMLRTAVRNPERLGAVERLMDVVRRSEELRDDDLLTLWDNVRALTTAGKR